MKIRLGHLSCNHIFRRQRRSEEIDEEGREEAMDEGEEERRQGEGKQNKKHSKVGTGEVW